jgi:Tol biopolymer transport system component
VINGTYIEASVIGEPVSKGNSGEEVIGMNAKGDKLLIYKPDYKGAGKIYLSTMSKNGDFSKPELLPSPINGSGDEIAACISNDGNTIYFASDRTGGFGGTDIYSSTKQSNGKWGEPKNMGVGVNTPFNEDFPNISPDGSTFYFSSKGHASMGGYDIFKAQWDPSSSKFINPRNMGYPINTSYDDMNFRISGSGKYGYLASVRGGGAGDYDIYRISFNDDELDYTVLIGQISSRDNSAVPFKDVFITINDNVTNQMVGSYMPNPVNGRFIIMLPAGKYILNAEAPGFKPLSLPIEILDKASYQSEKNLFVELNK